MKGDPATNERLARLERAGLVRRSKRPLKGSLKRYVKPLEPVINPDEWDVNK